jgi:hypothetical protein
MPETWIERHHWFVFALLLAVLVIVFVVAYYASASMQTAEAQAPVPYVITEYDSRLLELERKAIEDAFAQKITSLWTVWMSDDRGQPARALTGAAQARKAFVASMQQLDRRERELKERK